MTSPDLGTFARTGELFERVFQETRDAIAITTLGNATFVAVNDAFLDLYGHSRQEVIGKSAVDMNLWVDAGERDAMVADLLDDGLARGVARFRRADGSINHGEYTVQLIEVEGEKFILTTARGVSDRIEEEARTAALVEELRRAHDERRHLLARVVATAEDERHRIADDLHDDPIQKMAAAALRVETLKRGTTDPEQLRKLNRLEEEIELAVDRLRHLMFELRPPVLDRYGLAAALERYTAETFDEESINTEVVNGITVEPPLEIRNLAYRITQEALTNARKHAHATTVRVELRTGDGDVLEVRVIDDGRGFVADRDDRSRPGHLGLLAMRERAEMAGGTWSIRSETGRGTTVTFRLPAPSE